MLIAFVLLASIDAVPSSTVTLTLTGTADAAPVSAAPRSLSDIARELREGSRKGVGGFSAVETTVPRSLAYVPQPYAFEPDILEPERGPEVVDQQPPAYTPAYYPSGYGGYLPPRRFRQRATARASSPAAPGKTPPRPSSLTSQSHHAGAGFSRPIR